MSTPEASEETTGQRVRAARLLAGLSGSTLGKLAGISYTYISRIECDRYLPPREVMERVAKALYMPQEALYPGGIIPEDKVQGRPYVSEDYRSGRKRLAAKVGDWVHTARIARRLSVEKVAAKTGTQLNYLYRIDEGHATPSMYTLVHITRGMGWSLHDLLAFIEEED